MFATLKTIVLVAAVFAIGAQAETHTVTFTNLCGTGTPRLKANGVTLSTGGAYTSNGPLKSAIAYLDVGCGDNGEGCTMIETTLVNPTTAGSGSSTDITLISPHSFSVTTGFGYYNGCDGAGADCKEYLPNSEFSVEAQVFLGTSASCSTAFHSDGDTSVQVACQTDNVNLAITFCD
ncbi:glycopeptide [Lentinula raphanica]|uniref:Glycopeptide n=1 Tax=Lentinula raphanica TaxID=153919 RepID=A0AA38PJA0_9AGAR|nr:glycopeptide [Lentinula raphanica]